MIIPVYVDEKKDAELLKWLNEQTNRSAFVRFVLYEKMKNGRVFSENIENIFKNHEKSAEIEDSFINSIGNL
jgi:hypothetical protein